MRKDTRPITRRLRLAPVIVAAAAATAIASAPAVSASANPAKCRGHGGGTMCHKSGHSSMTAKPTTKAPQQTAFGPTHLPGFGKGHLPPLIALD